MPVNDWRSPAAYGHSKHLTAAGFAWEYLRRNADYRQDFRAAAKVRRQNPAPDAFPRRWGLRFPA